jgi:hypothetical protein
MWESIVLATSFGRRQLRKQFCASFAEARFYTAWVIFGSQRSYPRGPLYPDQRTSSEPVAMSQTCQKATSLDHLVGAAKQHRWHFEAERFRSLEIDTQLEFSRLVKRDISRISTSQNLVDDVGEAAIDFR